MAKKGTKKCERCKKFFTPADPGPIQESGWYENTHFSYKEIGKSGVKEPVADGFLCNDCLIASDIDDLLEKANLDVDGQGPVDSVAIDVQKGVARLYDDHNEAHFDAKRLVHSLSQLVFDFDYFCDSKKDWDYFWAFDWAPKIMEQPNWWE